MLFFMDINSDLAIEITSTTHLFIYLKNKTIKFEILAKLLFGDRLSVLLDLSSISYLAGEFLKNLVVLFKYLLHDALYTATRIPVSLVYYSPLFSELVRV